MAKGLDQKFLHYGIRREDLDLIESLCEKHHLDFNWLSEEILRKYHAAKVDKMEMLDSDYKPLHHLIAVGRDKGISIIFATQNMDRFKSKHFDFYANAQFPLII